MRVARYLLNGTPRLGLVEGDAITELVPPHNVDRDAASARRYIEAAGLGWQRGESAAVDTVDLLAPIDDPSKIVAVGLNYVDHASEGAVDVPVEPLVFTKFPSAIVGPGVPIAWPAGLTDGVDWEAELAVVIGSAARCVPVADALDHVFGYTCLNDLSARDLQFADGQWVRAKSLDTFCPIGPWIVGADEVPDPDDLEIACRVSGERVQHASTADMVFGVADLISRLSHWFTLEPGDVIATGTPPGVGWFREPRRVLAAGDVVSVDIDRIGTLTNPVIGPVGARPPTATPAGANGRN